jgi:hypothetical protein
VMELFIYELVMSRSGVRFPEAAPPLTLGGSATGIRQGWSRVAGAAASWAYVWRALVLI